MRQLHSPRSSSRARAAVAGLALAGIVLGATAGTALAAGPAAHAYGAQVAISDTAVVPPSPTATVEAPTGDDTNTLIGINRDPVIVNGTLTATANAHDVADIESDLTVVEQEVAGPYHARAGAEVEDLGIVYDVAGHDIALVSAALVRAEAVVVCGATPTYSATSEIVDLAIAGTEVPLNAPVEDLIDAITDALAATGLDAVVDVQRNVIYDIPGGGIAVDALVVTILSAAGDPPLATVTVAHAEVSAAACAAAPECSDGTDNDGDAVIDSADPGCHTDGDAANAASYDPADDDERDGEVLDLARVGELPRTGASATTSLVGAAAIALALGGLAMRRHALVR